MLHVEHHRDGDLDSVFSGSTSGDIPVDISSVIARYNFPENPDLVSTAIQVGRDS
jgi:hypothetical protein